MEPSGRPPDVGDAIGGECEFKQDAVRVRGRTMKLGHTMIAALALQLGGAVGQTFGNDDIYAACNAKFDGTSNAVYKKAGCEFYNQGYSGGSGYSCCSLSECNTACVRRAIDESCPLARVWLCDCVCLSSRVLTLLTRSPLHLACVLLASCGSFALSFRVGRSGRSQGVRLRGGVCGCAIVFAFLRVCSLS